VCNLYLHYEDNSKDKVSIQTILKEISMAEDILIHERRAEHAERISTLLSIISIFFGFLAIPFLASLSQEIARYMPTDAIFIVFLPFFLPVILELPILWLLPKMRWYLEVMKLCDVKKKELATYDSLLPFERVIMSKAFPKIRWMLDES
jgi:hypothetical protein